jgi:hypothetical protein
MILIDFFIQNSFKLKIIMKTLIVVFSVAIYLLCFIEVSDTIFYSYFLIYLVISFCWICFNEKFFIDKMKNRNK